MPSYRGKPSNLPIAVKRIGNYVPANLSKVHSYGSCTATCSRGAKYSNWSLHCHLQPWSQIQLLVLALLLAVVEPNTTTGPCTATCSRGAWYNKKKQHCLLEFGWVREGDRASLHK